MKTRGPSKLGNRELALAFELEQAGVKRIYIAEGLGCSLEGLRDAMNNARKRGMYERRRQKRARHTTLMNNIAYWTMQEGGHI